MAVNILKAGLASCTVNGNDVQKLTHVIRIYESMCKPYRTAEITLLNKDGLINQLHLTTGMPVSFTVIDSEGKSYSMNSNITVIPDEMNGDKLREEMITIVTATPAFFKDRSNTVQASFADMPVTTAAQIVHSMYIGTPLQIIMPSIGMIAMSQSVGGLPIAGIKPFAAIRSIIDRATYGGVKTGASVYFENRLSHVIGPLEGIFAQMGTQAHLVQKETWGTSWQHTFGYDNARNAIIQAKLYKKETDQGGGGSMAMTSSLPNMLLDIAQNKPLVDAAAAGVGAALGAFGVRGGGIPIAQLMNTNRNPQASDPSTKTLAESNYIAQVKDSPNYLFKIGLQAGFDITVGKGFHATLPRPRALGMQGSAQELDLLCADWMSEAYFDNRVVQGTTIIRGVQPV